MILEPFYGKPWAIVQGFFQKPANFLNGHNSKNLSRNKLKGHQYVSKNVIKIWCDFGANFWKKPWAIVQGFFQKLANFLNGHNSKNLSLNRLKLSTQHKDINMYQKM